MIHTLAFLIGLAVFVVALVAMVAAKLDIFAGGIDVGLSIGLILLSYPAVLNRST
ncbi:MAG TPA: hypothetical protein VH593_29145 [Ktedonobacteraceae bacterium]|jgi:hypothetical protein